jgi:hypothetical protein
MAANLRYARDEGVRAFYAEAYPNWGEGPKLYVTARLLWNPDADVDELLRDWYVSCAGEEAAADLARYYEHWEDFWTRRVLDSPWFGRSEILSFRSQGYLGSVTLEEMAQCRALLESAMDKTQTTPQRARVQILLNAFDGYEDAALYYQVNTSEFPPEQKLSAFVLGDLPAAQTAKARQLLEVLEGRATLISNNPSFEDGDDQKPDNWMLWWYQPDGVIEWIEHPDAPTGGKCVRVTGIRRGGPVQQVRAQPGRHVMVASCRLPAEQKSLEVEMNVALKDIKGRTLHTDTYLVKLMPGQWRTIARPFTVPEQVGETDVTGVQFVPVINNLGPDEKIYIDDVRIYRP